MAEQFYTILTAVGKAKIANAAALGKKVELTELALGDGGGSYYNPSEDQTELRNEVWRGAIGTVDVDGENPNWIIIQTVVPSQHGGFMIREAGVFDDEGDLIAVGKYPETYKPVAADGSIKDLVIRMILEVSNTASVVLKVDPTVILATQQQVNEAEARAKNYADTIVGIVNRNLETHKNDNVTVHGVARGISNFAGGGKEVTIPHGLGVTPTAAYAFPTSNPEGYLGEVWIRMDDTNLYIGNSGSFTGEMCWVAIK